MDRCTPDAPNPPQKPNTRATPQPIAGKTALISPSNPPPVVGTLADMDFPQSLTLLLLVYAALLQQRTARLSELAIHISGQLASIQRTLRQIARTAPAIRQESESGGGILKVPAQRAALAGVATQEVTAQHGELYLRYNGTGCTMRQSPE